MKFGPADNQLGAAMRPEAKRFLEIDKQHADLRIARDVAHQQIHAVAVTARKQQRRRVENAHETG